MKLKLTLAAVVTLFVALPAMASVCPGKGERSSSEFCPGKGERSVVVCPNGKE
ncbi:hypothetical protein [Leptospira sp. GIMC2001]|uniref:hypothetical protein n=1 Tax=Leptospira sp. GIMC2001 TaxID=1513297 RepID=UPI0023493E92|nr:hypothetical protein [Leptospira sp. GIMC2001]WCL49546.1 hypothetical protein O4O04_01645 [Leptospira sp. GIMC2001]